jgi:micrococcal nuclease
MLRRAALALAIGLAVAPAAAQPETYRVERVVDGDTVILETIGRVRLIGVDTPETVDPRKPVQRFGQEAAAFLRSMLEGRTVRLEYDRPRRDRYRRTLAYAYRDDGVFVNLEIVRQGYGHAYTRYPFAEMERFRSAEREAREHSRGLWVR